MLDLSVIVPVYNTEKYLRRCLDSVVKKFPDNSELIIINDGTKDNSENIILEFKDKYNFIKYIKKENTGLADTKNRGLQEAKGKYIIFLDSDDYVDENMYQHCLEIAKEKNADIVYTDVMISFDDEEKNYYIQTSSNKIGILKHLESPIMAASWNKMVKRKLYENLTFEKGIINEDVAVTPLLFLKSKNIVKINLPYYYYYQRSDSIINSKFNLKKFDIFKASNILFDRISNYNIHIKNQIYGTVYNHQLFDLYLYNITHLKYFDRVKYTKIFLDMISKYTDIYDNEYVIAYFKEKNIEDLLMYFKDKNLKKIIKFKYKGRIY